MAYQKQSSWRLILRSLSPSVGSLVISMVVVVLIIGSHLLLRSQDTNLFLPHLAGHDSEQVAQVYSSRIVQPLDEAFGSSALGTLSSALVWGVAGWATYALLDLVITAFRDWRRSKNDITMISKSQVIKHPLYRQLLIRQLWRFFVGLLLVVFTVMMLPLVGALLTRDVQILKSASGTETASHLAVVFGGWLAVLHGYVVLFRLFLVRTRVFGELIY